MEYSSSLGAQRRNVHKFKYITEAVYRVELIFNVNDMMEAIKGIVE